MKRTLVVALMVVTVLTVTGVAVAHQVKTYPTPPATAAAGTQMFNGTWTGTYSSSVVPTTNVTLIFQQRGTTVTGTYLSANGAQGVMSGVAGASGLSAIATQITPTCTGQFAMAAQVNSGTMTWTFVGQDCLGVENGKGTATQAKP